MFSGLAGFMVIALSDWSPVALVTLTLGPTVSWASTALEEPIRHEPATNANRRGVISTLLGERNGRAGTSARPWGGLSVTRNRVGTSGFGPHLRRLSVGLAAMPRGRD